MTEWVDLLPAFAGTLLGIIALVSAHVATRRLLKHQKVARDLALAEVEANEPYLPLAGIGTVGTTAASPSWYGGGGLRITARVKDAERTS